VHMPESVWNFRIFERVECFSQNLHEDFACGGHTSDIMLISRIKADNVENGRKVMAAVWGSCENIFYLSI
jgi:hypothetical protein